MMVKIVWDIVYMAILINVGEILLLSFIKFFRQGAEPLTRYLFIDVRISLFHVSLGSVIL